MEDNGNSEGFGMKWQPIDTAPRDGTEVIIFDPRADLGPVMMARNYDWHWFDRNDRIWMPTHWMPLPDAPEEAVPGGASCHSPEQHMPETTPKGEQAD